MTKNSTLTIPQYQLYGQLAKRHDQLDFHIQTIEAFNDKFNHYHHPHRHTSLYQLSWITGGNGFHSIDTKSFPLTENCLYLLAPGIVHTCHASQDLTGFVLHFSPAFLLPSPTPLTNANFQLLQANKFDGQQITEVCQKILQEFKQAQKGKFQMIQLLLTMLLIHKDRFLSQQENTLSKNNQTNIYQQFQTLVNQHFATEKRLAYYAKALNISVAHLKDCVKRITGNSATTIIRNRLLLEAKRQLIYSQLSISEIAYQLGFNDANYFFKYFRKYVGQPAGNYRKEHQKII
ncbi:MAG: helix-turn-helix transcriptional regulator [Bacteroidota bacterium]